MARSAAAEVYSSNKIPLETGRRRLVILGMGWGAARLVKDINPKLFDITVVSLRNHMVFTPLLASTTVGTLDFRSVAVHCRDLQPALSNPQNDLYIARASTVYAQEKVVECQTPMGKAFRLPYDVLAICTGAQGSTFGIPGVEQHAFALRDIHDAAAIRNRLLDNLHCSQLPVLPRAEVERLLHIVVVGGGPTGVEFSGEICDFIHRDLRRHIPERALSLKVTLVEANELLGSFDQSLRVYAARKLTRLGVHLVKGIVQEVKETELVLQDGTIIPYGICVWSTGVGPTPFISALSFAKTAKGRLAIDGRLRVLQHPLKSAPEMLPQAPQPEAPLDQVELSADEATAEAQQQAQQLQVVPNVYALGDCCANVNQPLPALAQVAEQQGRYLASALNRVESGADDYDKVTDFQYRHLGSMASLGGHAAVLELGSGSGVSLAGFFSWVAWRSAYMTRLGSWRKRLYVAVNWTAVLIFGRDLSQW